MKSAFRIGVMTSFCIVLGVGSATAQKAELKLAMDNYRQYDGRVEQTADGPKEKAIKQYRAYYGAHPYRLSSIKTSVEKCLSEMNSEGVFVDMMAREKELISGKGDKVKYLRDSQEVGVFLTDAFNRIWKIAEAFRNGEMTPEADKTAFQKLQKSILYYGDLELRRSNQVNRFHASCFAIPTAAVNIYFCFLKQMDQVEEGKLKNSSLVAVSDVLKALALQAWTQPLRKDETDRNVVQIERFRNHVWWVGGNALAYRSLLPVAIMYRSVPMVDLLAEVCQRGISMTSQNTYEDAFWTEGFTVDGAGWGHGKQCLVWGYPIDGTIYALNILAALKDSPWEKKLTDENKEALLNFFRGSNYYYYKGVIPPCLDRGSMAYNLNKSPIRYQPMLNLLLKDFSSSFTAEELAELKQLRAETDSHLISMKGTPEGMYNGTRWFFNNDDLIKKNDDYQMLINMASVRCDGLESATNMADEYNFYDADGLTFFQKSGDEYRKIIGASDVTASPGITAREGMDKLTPVTNWRGYCSKHNFAAGATHGGENAVGGFIFEKMNASEKDGVNDRGNSDGQNAVLYGVKAYKSYFLLGDYLVALGAGITNSQPEQAGTIRTTIDQTAHEAEVVTLRNGKKEKIVSESAVQPFVSGNAPVWLMQEGKFAYTVLPDYTKNAYYVCETKTTDWVKRNITNRDKKELPATADILRVWIDHGQQPVNDTYGYVVYAGKGMPQAELPFEVLRNDTLAQAVCMKDGSVVESIFYDPSVLLQTPEGELKVSIPCAVLIERNTEGWIITVTDAEMKKDRKEMVVTWQGQDIRVQLPQGSLGGKPATVQCNK